MTQKESAAKVIDQFIQKIATPGQVQTLKNFFDVKNKDLEERLENVSMKILENQL